MVEICWVKGMLIAAKKEACEEVEVGRSETRRKVRGKVGIGSFTVDKFRVKEVECFENEVESSWHGMKVGFRV